MLDVGKLPQIPMPCPRQDVADVKHDLGIAGVGIWKGFLAADKVAQLRSRLEEQAELEREQGVALFADPLLGPDLSRDPVYHMPGSRIGRPKGLPPFQFVSYLPNKGREFIDICCSPALADVANHILRDDLRIALLSGLIVRKGAPSQMIHTDQQMVSFETPRPMLCNFMLALSDFRDEMGATRFVPGSHRLPAPVRMAGEDALYLTVEDIASFPAEMEPGDICLFDSRTWHGQGPCVSNDTRVSILGNISVYWWNPYEDYTTGLHDAVYSSLGDTERVALGFRCTAGNGLINPRNPDDIRRNTNLKLPYIPELRRGEGATAISLEGIEEWEILSRSN